MKVIKKINNNVAICVDGKNHELIAFGKGIGFRDMPYELEDLSLIERTYYGVDQKYLGLLNEISDQVLAITTEIVDYANGVISAPLNPNLVFTLADHIDFAIKRYKKKMMVKMPLYNDFEHLYAIETDIGKKGINIIFKKTGILLPKDEAIGIAMNILNSESRDTGRTNQVRINKIIERVNEIVEKTFEIKIDRESAYYARYLSHMQYLMKRLTNQTHISSENIKIYDALKNEFPKTSECSLLIRDYLANEEKQELNDEELLYLIIHINRLCMRDDYSSEMRM